MKLLNADPVKKVRFRLLRQQVAILTQIRDTWDAGSISWVEKSAEISDIETLIRAMNAVDKSKDQRELKV